MLGNRDVHLALLSLWRNYCSDFSSKWSGKRHIQAKPMEDCRTITRKGLLIYAIFARADLESTQNNLGFNLFRHEIGKQG
ncbi:MAG: hypothetical protein DF168_01522 [Candidatus Moanabacter tarae]|uniref:Uncharacterized protein n=1 Tax=Candidatus Moanibacter tarae TaxID=2200854 RepID=A0A2Z4AGR2_9BACT|nr:MAG: hypothetical protein DF168_01522 [Candidatus Moanabacter tarae]